MAEDHPIVEDLLRYREVEKLRSTYADALPPLIARRRAHPRHVQADRHHHRAHLERGAQPPERARAHRRRSRDAARVRRRRRVGGSSPPTTRRSSCACSRTSPRTRGSSTRSSAASTCTPPPRPRCSASTRADGRRRAAPLRQGRQLRPRLRHGGLRARPAARHPDRRGGRDPRRLLRRLPERAARSWRRRSRRRRSAATPPRSSVAAGRSASSSSDNFRIRQMGERMAQNAPVQGSAADIFKLAMIDLDRALDEADSDARMLLTVHDELVLEVPESRARRHRDPRARRHGAASPSSGSRSPSTPASAPTGPRRSSSELTRAPW